MSKWFRWYEGTCEDGKFRVTARNAGVTVATVMGVWAALLEDASCDDHRGVATRGEDFYAAILDVEPKVLQCILEAMENIKLISVGHAAITITKWKERQFESDGNDATNADRQRRFREKQKANKHETDVTPLRNGTVTATKRPDTDTDTDTEKKEHCPDAKAPRTKQAYSDEFETKFWLPYPRSPTMAKKEAWREWMKLTPELRSAACQAIEPYKKYLRSKPNLETVHACRFLSQQRFDGFVSGDALAQSAPDIRSSLV